MTLGGSEPAILPLRVTGEILPNATITVSPSVIDFGNVAYGESKRREVRLARFDGTSVSITAMASQSNERDIEYAIEQDGSSARISAIANGRDASSRDVRDVLVVETSFGKVEIPVRAHFAGIAGHFVSAIAVDSVALGGEATVNLWRDLAALPKRISVRRVVYDGEAAQSVAVALEQKGAIPQVAVSVAATTAGSPIRGMLAVEFDDGQELRIPMTIHVRQ